jgi:hypothetical protein
VSETLITLQRGFADHLRDPGAVPAPAGASERRLQVYRDLVYRNIEGFIKSTFPVLRSLHDEQAWDALVREFIREHRCHSPLFLEISEEFIAFLVARGLDPQMPFMAELAHYEWLELAVDVAEGEVPLSAPGESPANVSAVLSPTARLGSYHYAVHRIGKTFRPTAPDEPVSLLVYRDRNERVQFMELSAGAARLLFEASKASGESVQQLLFALAREWNLGEEATLAFGWEKLREFSEIGAIELCPIGVGTVENRVE